MEMLKKGLKVEFSLKIQIIFLSFINLYDVQKSEKVELYL